MSLQLEEKLPQDCEVFYKQTLFWLIMCYTTQNPFKRKAVMFQPLARPFQKHITVNITVNIYCKEKKTQQLDIILSCHNANRHSKNFS